MTIKFIIIIFSIVEHIPLPKSGFLQFCSQFSHIDQNYVSVLKNIQASQVIFWWKPTSRMDSSRLTMVLFLFSPALSLYTCIIKIVGTWGDFLLICVCVVSDSQALGTLCCYRIMRIICKFLAHFNGFPQKGLAVKVNPFCSAVSGN